MESKEQEAMADRSDGRDNLDLELSLRPPGHNTAAPQPLSLGPPPVENTAAPQQLISFRPPVDDIAAPQPVLLPMPPLLFPQTSNQILIPHPCTSSGHLPAIEQRNPRTLRPRRTSSSSSTASDREPAVSSRRTRTKPKNTPIKPPYPWSTDLRAVVHSLNYLRSNQILTIAGDVKCDRCWEQYKIEYDLVSKFNEIATFIEKNKHILHDRAPRSWTNPTFPNCKFCNGENSAKPVIPEKKKNINWLFLLLGQTLGILNIDHLKYFCTYTNNHRTGAKNRILYLTYLALCKQLEPRELFDR